MSYWTRRQEQLKQTAEKDEAKLKKRLSSFFDTEFKRLEREIAAYYQTYGVDNVIEYRRLLESLPDEDRQLLIERMDEFARKYPQYADLMPVRETIYRLNRLEGLQYSVFMEEANIAGYTSEQMTTYLTGLSQKGVNMAMETLGFGKSFYAINAAVVKQFVDVPWCNGENFSTRIWNDTRKLAQYLNQDIAQGFARGDSYDKLVRQLRKRFSNVNRRDAYRLIFTEGTYVMAESSMQPFTEDFERYRLSPVMDGRTCPICRSLARQVFEIKDRQPGVNFPPIHPWCRCTWEIVVDDWDRWIDDYVAKHSGDAKRAETVAKRVGDTDLYMSSAQGKLTDQEISAINKYISSDSYKLNAKLREGLVLSDDEQEWKRNLDYAIVKLPKYEGAVYRSISSSMINDLEDFNKKHMANKIVRYDAYTSASTSVYDASMDIQMIIQSKRGADMREFNPREGEIIFKRGSLFFITKREGNTIWMTEV